MSHIHFEFPITEKTYKVKGERKLKLYIIEPKTPKKNRAAILFFMGGTFKKNPNSPAHFQYQAKYFSSQGMVAICVDYRNGEDEGFTPVQAIVDAKSAVRWVRRHSDDLGIDPNKIVMCGSSAGGYVCVSSIMLQGLDDDEEEDNQTPNALVIFGAGMDGVDIMRRRYPQLLDRATELSPIHQIRNCLPPTLWLSGSQEEDAHRAGGLFEQNKKFIKQMITKGNEIKLVSYEGMEHGFFRYGRHNNKYFHMTNTEIKDFLESLEFI
ncbi:alpha/beta hydrolase [Gracilibacillus salinarum]|uniref:Alpha/beta hydrolase n=1 Tax=Gracilibacillus salinarum TaxID=2932255 RepID=A0ABY4GJL2_9BACI|nr:alpha/beta hydrolase [Gracilibacillus salinarum]UOQ84389.1 alpha/beta hydrolase [Gracilibacillus salinarum]